MSLFKTREWWSATGDGEELHTTGSLLVAALGDDRYGEWNCCVVAEKIILTMKIIIVIIQTRLWWAV